MYDSDVIYQPNPVTFQRPMFSSSFSSPAACSFNSTTSSAPASASGSPSPPPTFLKPSHSLSKKHRPQMPKKMSSTTGKHKSVQVSLEVKVERSKGFHAFFVPLARSMPPAPPSSPVLAHSEGKDFPEWSLDGSIERKGEERWVEDIEQPPQQRMDLD